ncbi:MAG: helix-turn-helix domain-containing protein [Caldilineaceae bacterium SB0661_bin_32]|uniref:Helix-turn-helix domain-containing protein n=1 Tax=Caldilineaceae bacterium SB0661_bin_32 TaxID=2605255 RepID=A0A6B1D2N6_9CHLR|nr:helix-turn-helix domain-containing protein [Caldilineaceae bacterium SB0661_bin_32]
MALYVRKLEEEEWEELERIIQNMENDVSIQRLMIILLSAQGHKVQEISREVDLHPINVRKWIHRYNRHGLDGLRSGKSPGRPPVFTAAQRQAIVDIASADPTSLKLPFNQWSLQRLRKYLIDEEVVAQISVETIRQILRTQGIQPRLMGGQHQDER